MAVEDAGSSQGESVINVVGAGESEGSPDPLDVPVEKLERGEEEAILAKAYSVRNETVCAAVDFVMQSSVLRGDTSKAGDEVFLLETVPPAQLMMKMNMLMWLGAVPSALWCGACGFQFRESVSHAFLRDSGGVFDISGPPFCKFLFYFIFTLL